MSATLFDDVQEGTPAWAEECTYCVRDLFGQYDHALHMAQHLPITCAVCGETEPNRYLAELSHKISLGASWDVGALLCTSLALRLNHLSYDTLHARPYSPLDASALDLGWRITLGGIQIPPDGWPPITDSVNCELLEAA